MKYVLIDDNRADIYTQEFPTLEEAIKAGNIAWDHLTSREQAKREGFYVLESVNPDEDASDHLDGNPVMDWKRR